MTKPHFILVTYPAQGHINPALQFAKRLASIGVDVSFVITTHARRRMSQLQVPNGIAFVDFSDGYDGGFNRDRDDSNLYMSEFIRSSEAISKIISSGANEGRPVNCIVYSILLPWVTTVAREHDVPSALLWIQPATVLNMYYYYFNGYGELMREKFNDSSSSLEIPKLPLSLTCRDLPSFFNPKDAFPFALSTFKDHIDFLSKETHPNILINTFDALEPEALKSVDKYYRMIKFGD